MSSHESNMSSHECVMSLGIFGAPRLDDDALLHRRENPTKQHSQDPPCLGTLRACAQLLQRVARGTLPALWAHLSQPNNTPRLLLRQQLPSLLPSSHDLSGKQKKQGDSALRDSKSRTPGDLRGDLQSPPPPNRSCAAGRQALQGSAEGHVVMQGTRRAAGVVQAYG